MREGNQEIKNHHHSKIKKKKINVRKVPLGKSTAQAPIPRQGEELGVKRRMRWRVLRWAIPRASITQGKPAARDNGVLPLPLENIGVLGHVLVSVGLT